MALLELAGVAVASGCCFICSRICCKRIENLTSFKMLLRFLNIDIDTLSRGVSSKNDSCGGGVNVDICDGCSSRLNGFWRVYQDFERLRLQLNEFVEGVYDTMKGSGSDDRRSDFIMELRDTTLKQCANKVQSVPRVILEENIYPGVVKVEKNNNRKEVSKDNSDSDTISTCEDDYIDIDMLLPTCKMEVDSDLPPSELEGQTGLQSVIQIQASSSKSTPIDMQMVDESEEYPTADFAPGESSSDFSEDEPPPASVSLKVKSAMKASKTAISNNFLTAFYKSCESPSRRRRNNDESTVECVYCRKTFSSEILNWNHMLQSHIMELYSSTIPPGTTEAQIQAATMVLFRKHKKYPSGIKLGCPYCRKTFGKKTLKGHLQDIHFDKVLIALENPNDPSLKPVSKPRSKKLKVPVPVPEIGPVEAVKPRCLYCGDNFEIEHTLTVHAMMVHTWEYFNEQLNPGTTKKQLDTVIENILSSVTVTKDKHYNNKTRFQCPCCPNTFAMMVQLKRHLLYCHFAEVVGKLAKK